MLLTFILSVVLGAGTGCARDDFNRREYDYGAGKTQMIETLKRYGIRDPEVLRAMSAVRRHVFIPEEYRHVSDPYGDHPCPIGHGQTISQPYIVAYMTERMAPKPGEKILEIGTGSGYQAAVLAELGAEVYTIEIIPELAEHARRVLKEEGYDRVHVLTGDGYKGWPAQAPFDAIMVTCAPEEVPQTLVDQLADGGRMILPLGSGFQRLVLLRKRGDRTHIEEDLPVRFVPMVRGR
jgi:protein-L-isoaspartate(D-aspartate) O-methyltransferase